MLFISTAVFLCLQEYCYQDILQNQYFLIGNSLLNKGKFRVFNIDLFFCKKYTDMFPGIFPETYELCYRDLRSDYLFIYLFLYYH